MPTYAIIENGLVVNIVIWDGVTSFVPPSGKILIQIQDGTYTGPGATYVNGAFGDPPNPQMQSME